MARTVGRNTESEYTYVPLFLRSVDSFRLWLHTDVLRAVDSDA
jgi:hypothetical protein